MELFVVCCAGTFILPLWIGLKLFSEAQRHRGSLLFMAALFTLKPLLATPMWILLYSSGGSSPTLLSVTLSILPAVVITTALVMAFRNVFANPSVRPKAWALLALDWVRWGCTLMLMLLGLTNSSLAVVFVPLSLLMPSIYAIVAYRLTSNVIELPSYEA